MSEETQPEWPQWRLHEEKVDKNRSRRFNVLETKDAEDGYPNKVAVLVEQTDPQDPKRPAKPGQYPYWRLSCYNLDPKTALDLEGTATFKELDHAFEFVKMVREAYLSEIARRPLTDDLNRFLTRRAADLRDRMRAATNAVLDLHSESYELLQLCRKYGVREAEVYVDGSDIGKAFDDMIRFRLDDDGKEEGDVDTIPFFSESCLYPLIGKDKARTLLGRFERLISLVSPSKRV